MSKILLFEAIKLMAFFFFSSRRRHTRWNCHWSSDVCSSDLPCRIKTRLLAHFRPNERFLLDDGSRIGPRLNISQPQESAAKPGDVVSAVPGAGDGFVVALQIGRASCRERV